MNCKNDRDAVKYSPLLWRVYKEDPKKRVKNGIFASKGLKIFQRGLELEGEKGLDWCFWTERG